MAIPRVFISSTCYDLKHIRENLKYFVKTVGYEPVLSNEGDVYYNPSDHTIDSCMKEVETCQIFILIIGGRNGGVKNGDEKSITNREYSEAIKNNVPVFALVESAVLSDHYLYIENKEKNANKNLAKEIIYPSIDNLKIFDFIDEVRKSSTNNAICPFNDFSEMETYLKKQWAGMMYDFLIQRNNKRDAEVTNRLLDNLTHATEKSEALIKVLLKSTSNEAEEVDAQIDNIDTRFEAQKFPKLIFTNFGINYIQFDMGKNYAELNLPESWVEFLLRTDNFAFCEMGGLTGFKAINGNGSIFSPSANMSMDMDMDMNIDMDNRLEKIKLGLMKDFPEITKSYDALKKIDQEERMEILSIFEW